MTDINGTVVGLQGNPVDDESPTDGYVLTWDGDDGYWVPRPTTGLRKEYFTSNDTWTCPDGVTTITLVGAGSGGGGGGGGRNTFGGSLSPTLGQGGGAGGSALQGTIVVSVTSGETYDIIIGASAPGGLGAQNANSFDIGDDGAGGNPTQFKHGSNILASFKGAGQGMGGGFSSSTRLAAPGGSHVKCNFVYREDRFNAPVAYGGSVTTGLLTISGQYNCIGDFSYGSNGSGIAGYSGGAGGAAGPQGNGGNGGNGSSTPTNGSDGPPNSGGGGDAGGGGGQLGMGIEAGDGGAGGSGYLYLIY